MATHPLKIPMYHIGQMEVVEAISNIRQLVAGVSIGGVNEKDAYEAKSVCVWVCLDICQ